MKGKSAHRYRICGTPVKTGCITCKIRRVKCGEEKPECVRCTSTGRKCDGYATPDKTSPGAKSPVPRSFSSTPVDDPAEQSVLSFFITSTAPGLSGYFSPNFWERRVLQATNEPSVRHGVIAIGAVHQNFLFQQESPGKECDPTTEAFAFRQHTKAISHLQQRMSTGTQQLDITLIACILFIVFDCMLGNYTSAIIHLKAGLKILEDIKLQNSHGVTFAQTTSAHEWEREFSPLLLALGVQVARNAYPMLNEERAALWASLTRMGILTLPNTFISLDEGRHALDTLVANFMAERRYTANHTNENYFYSPAGRETQGHVAALERWEEALERSRPELVKAHTLDLKTQLAISMLKIHGAFLSLFIGVLESWDEKFDRLLGLCEAFLQIKSSCGLAYPSFSVDLGVVAPLFFVASKTTQKAVKQRACHMLLQAGREAMWNNEDALRVASQAIGVETCQELHELLVLPRQARQQEARTWHYVANELGTSIAGQHGQTEQHLTILTSGIPFPSFNSSRSEHPFTKEGYMAADRAGSSNMLT